MALAPGLKIVPGLADHLRPQLGVTQGRDRTGVGSRTLLLDRDKRPDGLGRLDVGMGHIDYNGPDQVSRLTEPMLLRRLVYLGLKASQ